MGHLGSWGNTAKLKHNEFIVFQIKQYVLLQWGGAGVLCLLMPPTSMAFVSPFCFSFWGRATHFFTGGRHAAWVNRKKVDSEGRREDEMFLTNVTYPCMTRAMLFCMFAPFRVPIIICCLQI